MNPFDRFAAALEAEEAAERGTARLHRPHRGRPRLSSPPVIPEKCQRFCGAYVDSETHAALKALAESQRRTVASLCRVIYDAAIEGRLVPRS